MQEETVAQEEVSLRDYLDLLRRRIAIIVQTCIAALVIGCAVAIMQTPVYKSTGRLLVTPPVQQAVVRDSSDPISAIAVQGSSHNIDTQLEVLMNGTLRAKAYQAANVSPSDSSVNVNVGRANEMIDIIDLSVEAGKPTIAADVANNMMRLYIAEERTGRIGDISNAITFATKSLREAQSDWEKSSKDLQKYNILRNNPDYANSVTLGGAQLGNLTSKQNEMQATMVGNQAFIDETRAYLAKLPKTIDKSIRTENPLIKTIDGELVSARTEYKAILQKLSAENPTAKTAQARIENLERERKQAPVFVTTTEKATNPEITTTEMELRKMEAQMALLKASVKKNEAQKAVIIASQMALSKDTFRVSQLGQKIKSAQFNVDKLTTQLADMRLRETAQPSPIRVLSEATVNPSYIRPKRPLIIFMSGLAGLFLGVCFALLAEFMDDRVNAPEDARRLLGVPALGYIPRIEKEEQRLLSADRGGSLLESYRVLRSNVRFAAVGEPLNSMMVTSTTPGEGKSLTAANLAIAMALDGRKVILVDADLRRPTIHEKFGVRNTPGLTNVLVGSMSIDKALQDTEIENLQLMTSGPIPPNPAELLNSRAFEQVHEMLKERADLVIFDSPPCLSVADAQVLAANVDGLVYVVQLGSTKKSALKHGHELLKQARAKVLGIVYNKVQVDGRRNDYYYGYYSYYHKTELQGKSGSNGKTGQNSEWEGMISQSAQAKEANALSGNTLESKGDKDEV